MRLARFVLLTLCAVQCLPSAALGAQELSLGDALDRADRRAFGNRASQAAAAAAAASPVAALRGVLPTVRFDAGFVRTTDPIGAFGTILRQRAIAQQNFDPQRLNYPAVTPNYSGAIVLEQPLFNADALVGWQAATRAASAASAEAAWTSGGTRVDVVRAYFGAVLARERVLTLNAALNAARQHLRQAEQMASNGLVTSADVMLASVKAGEVEVMLAEADGDAATSHLALATLLGTPEDSAFSTRRALPEAAAIRRLAVRTLEASQSRDRADVTAVRAAQEAASADLWRARSLYLPRLNGFARYDWNSALRPYGGEKNWTVGVMASWTPFAGGSEIAERRQASARLSAITAQREGAEAKVTLEHERTAAAVRTALARVEIADRSVEQGVNAHRIVTRRYEGGLATIVELLDASAVETQTRLAAKAARYGLIVATAERLRAVGLDPGELRSLDAAEALAQLSPDF